MNNCNPYPPVDDQGDEVSCVARAMFAGLFCSMSYFYPELNEYPDTSNAFTKALQLSHDPRAGVSFGATARILLEQTGLDTKLKAYRVPTDIATFSRILNMVPIAVGYQVDHDRKRFHENGSFRETAAYKLPPFRGRAISGHAVAAVGLNTRLKCVIARNSWGTQWGADGHFLIPLIDIEDPNGVTDALAFLPSNFLERN